MKRLLLAASLFLLAAPAFAQNVVETDFTIAVPDGSGGQITESSTLVPLLEGACYDWHIKLAKTKGTIEVVEVYTMPGQPEHLGLDENGQSVVSDDGLTVTTTRSLTPDDGWIGDGWCVSAGDPVGPYSFEIKAGDTLLHRFEFTVEEL